ncbi:secreted protein CSS1-like [Coccinella septempunctata]|uniref:secreted protein CSS1-like n=1 Tax=Coccinella septempunctata TaxID=41139 RepID=UPI001D0701DD|nr:secreted protein CSS1-like [Coccinella septempunctata]
MVNRCVVCKKISSKSRGKSMHRMPIDSARQKLWMDQLKLKISESSKWVYVCSDHFCDEDFILKFGKKCLKSEAIPSRISLPDPCSSNTLAASDERYMTQDPSDVGKVGESSKLIGSELSETSDLSATASASDLSATASASDLSATLTASDLSATDMSVALAASDLSGKVDSLEVFDTEKFAAPHTNTSCCTSTASDGRSVTQTLSDIGRVEEFPKLSGSELSKTSTASDLSATLLLQICLLHAMIAPVC